MGPPKSTKNELGIAFQLKIGSYKYGVLAARDGFARRPIPVVGSTQEPTKTSNLKNRRTGYLRSCTTPRHSLLRTMKQVT
jgi:hypothetical protein